MQAAARAKEEAAKDADDPLQHKYGDLPLIQSQQQSGRTWTEISQLTDTLEGQTVRHLQTFDHELGPHAQTLSVFRTTMHCSKKVQCTCHYMMLCLSA